MDSNTLRQKYIQFFKDRGHQEIAPAPLVPINDPTTLFTSSGMQQLVPYLKGEPHPQGTRLVNSQPSFRAEDIDEVGDNRHTTFFEMLGNWSLGDYFKKEQLPWFYEFITQEIGIDPSRLYVTVFGGGVGVLKDEESIAVWQDLFKTKTPAKDGKEGFDPNVKIYTYDNKNWWSRSGAPDKMPPGEIGGPDSEVFYDFGEELGLHENSPFKDQPCHVNCDCGRFLEIGNSVFMQYEKQVDGTFKALPKQNVDFGGGLERLAMVSQGKSDIFEIDLFAPVIEKIESVSNKKYTFTKGDLGFDEMPECWEKDMRAMRVIADHLKASVFMIAAGVEPSNKTQGYFLRRYLRRAAVKMRQLAGTATLAKDFQVIAGEIITLYKDSFFTDGKLSAHVNEIIDTEITKFTKTLDRGLKMIEATPLEKVDEQFAFDLFQTYGFPFEVASELLAAKGKTLNKDIFDAEFKKHQDLSRTASKGMFSGGLADHSEAITKLHTATHLLNQALRVVLGRNDIMQVGSNITAERLRFDFTYGEKLTDEEMKQVEDLVNEQIKADLPVTFEVLDRDEALKAAVGAFAERYGDKVKVYSVGNFSKEICGGPHVEHTGILGHFSLGKQKAVGAGKRRLYGFLK